MNKRLKPWPGEFAAQYQLITNHARVLTRMAKIAWEHGVHGYRNIPLLETLLPLMRAEVEEVQNTCLWMQQHKQGRWAYWVNEALENIIARAIETVDATKRTERAIKRADWNEIMRTIEACLTAGPRIERELLSGPAPDDEE